MFDQYLRNTQIPKLTLSFEGKKITYQFEDCVEDLCFPVKLNVDGKELWIKPKAAQQSVTAEAEVKEISVDRNFYLRSSVNEEE